MDDNGGFSNLLEDVRHFVTAGVGVVVAREFSAGDKLSRHFSATVARLIRSIDALGGRSQRVIVVTIHRRAAHWRDESTGRRCGQSRMSVLHDVQS